MSGSAKAVLTGEALKAICTGTKWMTAAEVGDLLGQASGETMVNPTASAIRWKTQREVFAITHHGVERYPGYAFGLDGRPLPAMKMVIGIFGNSDPIRLAAWFESSSSFLGGRKPRELFQLGEEDRLIAAANDYFQQLRN